MRWQMTAYVFVGFVLGSPALAAGPAEPSVAAAEGREAIYHISGQKHVAGIGIVQGVEVDTT